MKSARLIYELDPKLGTNKLRFADEQTDATDLSPWEQELSRRTLEIHASESQTFRFQTPLAGWSPDFRLTVTGGPKRSRSIELTPLSRVTKPVVNPSEKWPTEMLNSLRELFLSSPPSHDRAVCVDSVLAQIESQAHNDPRLLLLLLLKGYLQTTASTLADRPKDGHFVMFYRITEEEIERIATLNEPAHDSQGGTRNWIMRFLSRYLWSRPTA